MKTAKKKTVGGITITHRWKQINEKTKALEELEKKGVIIIEEISKPTWPRLATGQANKFFGISAAISEKTRDQIIELKKSLGLSTPFIEQMENEDNFPKMNEEFKLYETSDFPNVIPSENKVPQSQIMEKIEKLEKEMERIRRSPLKESKKPNKISWNGSKRQLKRLFDALKNERLITYIKYSEFKIHFDIKGIETPYQETEIDKIRWNGTIRQLVYLDDLLIKKGYFDKDKHYILLSDNFIDKDGKVLQTVHLANTLTAGTFKVEKVAMKKEKYKVIREVVEQIGN
jgi:hypothetical protein